MTAPVPEPVSIRPDVHVDGVAGGAMPSASVAPGVPSATELIDVPIVLGVEAPRLARGVVAAALAGRASGPVVDRARLIVSELVSNSLRHGGAVPGDHVIVRVGSVGCDFRIEVLDAGRRGEIIPRALEMMGGDAVGLNLVEAFSECWAMESGPEGPTRVWAQLGEDAKP